MSSKTKTRYIAKINLDNPEHFEGRTVITREPARLTNHMSPNGYDSAVVDEVLLSDETTTYQCRKCARCFTSGNGGERHQRSHSPRHALNAAEQQIEQLKLPTAAQRTPRGPDRRPRSTPKTRATRDEVVNGKKTTVPQDWAAVIRRLKTLHDEIDSLTIHVTRLASQVTTTADPEVLEKAKKYDQLKGLMT